MAPPPVRPSVAMEGSLRSEDDLTFQYQQIVKHNEILKRSIENGSGEHIVKE